MEESLGRPGRPKKDRPRERILQIRLDDTELDLLRQKVEPTGLSVAAWARLVLLKAAKGEEKGN